MRISALQILAGLGWAPRSLPARNILWFCKTSATQLSCFLAMCFLPSVISGACVFTQVLFLCWERVATPAVL